MPLSALHPAFLRRLDANHARFPLGVELGRGAMARLTSPSPGAPTRLSASSRLPRSRSPELTRVCADILVHSEAQPSRVRRRRAPSAAGGRTLFADRHSLWADHLFEPLLEWVNSDLAEADRLALCGSPATRPGRGRSPSAPTPLPRTGGGAVKSCAAAALPSITRSGSRRPSAGSAGSAAHPPPRRHA